MKKNIYLNILKQWAGLSSCYSTMVLFVFATMMSCSDDGPGQAPLDIGELKASNTELVIDFDKPTQEVVTFSWHAEKSPAIQYELEFTSGGKSHKAQLLSEVSKRYRHAQFNAMMLTKLQLEIGKTASVDVTLHAKVTSGEKSATSNTVTISVVPTELIPEPPLEAITLSSLRSEAVIDITSPLSETATFWWGTEPNVFIEHKLVLTHDSRSATVDVLSDVSKEFTNAELNNVLIDKLQLEAGKPANITVIVQAAVTISDNTATSNPVTISVTPSAKDTPAATYPKLWIVGGATPNGWDKDNPNVMENDLFNPHKFKYNEVLKTGEFKIPIETGDWNADFFMPPVNHQDLSKTDVTLIKDGNPDNKWDVTNAGAYKILLNTSSNLFLKIAPYTPVDNLYIVGDATDAGWDANNALAMTVDPGDPNIFTWTGELKSAGRGQFRFLSLAGDLNVTSFVAPVSGGSISATQLTFAPGGIPANNFKVKEGEEGTYTITINQFKETISIVKQ